MAAKLYTLLALFLFATVCLAAPLSDGDAESIPAFYGFYGNPIYRPYGFGSWGWGSANYGYNALYVPNNGHNRFGGFMR